MDVNHASRQQYSTTFAPQKAQADIQVQGVSKTIQNVTAMVDVTFASPGKIDLLIGQKIFWNMF